MTLLNHRWLPFLLLLLAVWIPYGQSVYNERIGDDRLLLEARLSPEHVASPLQLWRENYWGSIDLQSGLYRPLALSLLYTERQLFGLETMPYRIVNLMLYSLCGLLCYVFARSLFAPLAALLAALLFVLHPAHVEVVVTAYGQVEMLSTAFVFAALFLHVRGRTALAALAFLAALVSKESAVCFPALAILTNGMWLTPDAPGWRRWTAPREALYAAPLVLYTAAKLLFIGAISVPAQASAMGSLSLLQRLFAIFTHGLGNYLRLTLFPLSQSIHYDHFTSALADAMWLPITALLLAALAWILGKRPVLYAVLWFGATWFIFSNLVVPTGIFVAERCLFLPVFALCLLFGLLTQRTPVFALVLLLAGVQSAITAEAWRTEESSLRAAVEEHPGSPFARASLATRLLSDPPVTPDRQQEAAALLQSAVTQFPNVADIHRALGLLALTQGDPNGAVTHLQNALRLRPRDTLIQRELAEAQRRSGQPR